MEQIHCTLAMPQEVSFVTDNFIIHTFFSSNCQYLAIYDKDLEWRLWGIYNCFCLRTDYIYFYFLKATIPPLPTTRNPKIHCKGNVIFYFA